MNDKLKNCKNGKFCCEGQMNLYNIYDILYKYEIPHGDLACEILTTIELIENCPFCKNDEQITLKEMYQRNQIKL
jgi:hypothetical protein